MAKTGIRDDNVFGEVAEAEKPKRGRQDDGTYITSTGEVLAAKNRDRRIPYDEPEEKQVAGNEEVVESSDGSVSFLAVRMTPEEFRRSGFTERKRLKCLYRVTEIYAGQPRPTYSYDELIQIRKGELKR